MNSLFPTTEELNRTAAVLVQEWLSHQITHESWNAIYTKTKPLKWWQFLWEDHMLEDFGPFFFCVWNQSALENFTNKYSLEILYSFSLIFVSAGNRRLRFTSLVWSSYFIINYLFFFLQARNELFEITSIQMGKLVLICVEFDEQPIFHELVRIVNQGVTRWVSRRNLLTRKVRIDVDGF